MIIKHVVFESSLPFARQEGTFSECPLTSSVCVGGPFLGGHNKGKHYTQMTMSPTVHMSANVLKVAFGGESRRQRLDLELLLGGLADEPLQYGLCSCDPKRMQEVKVSPLVSTATCNQLTLARRFHWWGKSTHFPHESRDPWSQNSLRNRISRGAC